MSTYGCDCGRKITDDNNYCRCGKTKSQVKALNIIPEKIKCPGCDCDLESKSIEEEECPECGEFIDLYQFSKIKEMTDFLGDDISEDTIKTIYDNGDSDIVMNSNFFFINDYDETIHSFKTEDEMKNELSEIAEAGVEEIIDGYFYIYANRKQMMAKTCVVLEEYKKE